MKDDLSLRLFGLKYGQLIDKIRLKVLAKLYLFVFPRLNLKI